MGRGRKSPKGKQGRSKGWGKKEGKKGVGMMGIDCMDLGWMRSGGDVIGSGGERM